MTFQRDSCNIGAPTDAAMYVEEVEHRTACQGGYPGLYDMSGNLEEWVDGCDKDTGSSDACGIAGNASYTGALNPDDITCHGSLFGAPRNTHYYLLGFRCCAD
jgi:formylglycine-generating enzyme required for sulfatase activity